MWILNKPVFERMEWCCHCISNSCQYIFHWLFPAYYSWRLWSLFLPHSSDWLSVSFRSPSCLCGACWIWSAAGISWSYSELLIPELKEFPSQAGIFYLLLELPVVWLSCKHHVSCYPAVSPSCNILCVS